MKRLFSLLAFLVLLLNEIFPQATTLLYEGFESGTLPIGWTEEKVTGNNTGNIVKWTFTKGGYNLSPAGAAAGTKNARFFYDSPNFETTKLITKRLNLAGRVKPVLEFYHIQMYWLWGENPTWDQLKVYYKNNSNKQWHLLRSYTQNIEEWTKQSILLPDSILTDNFYIAFEGINTSGTSVCIDEVKIYETDIAPRKVLNVKASQPITKFIATGSQMNPLLRLDVQVGGNDGIIKLRSIKVESKNTNDNDLSSYGVRCYSTSDSIWQNPQIINDSANFINGEANLSNLNYSLVSGWNSFWITYNVSNGALAGNFFDLKIEPNSIKIDTTYFPKFELDPSGRRLINEVLFSDNFETDKGWQIEGDFERSAPLGLGGYKGLESTFGPNDPINAYSGSKVLGNDLSGLETGFENGNIASNISGMIYASSPDINLSGYKNTILTFKRKLGIHYSHKATIEVSTDNGINWTSFWTNFQDGGSVMDNDWVEKEYNLSNIADRKEHFKIRFGIGSTNVYNLGCGWNIDDIEITGELVNNDVGVIAWNNPKTGCELTSAEPVNVTVKNFTNKASSNNIPIYYSIDGKKLIYDTIKTSIPANGTIDFTFKTKVNLNLSAVYKNVTAVTLLADDNDNRNNSFNQKIYAQKLHFLPYKEDFENDSSWISLGKTEEWEYGKPQKPVHIKGAASGVKAFSTYNYSYYGDGDSCLLESPCFNFANVVKPIFQFKFNSELEKYKDGVVLQYKLSDAGPWKNVPNHTYSWKWNWYNNYVSALKTKGWDTTTIEKWVTAKQVLPTEIAGSAWVKFRFLFQSNDSNSYEGFSIDDIEIFEAPEDLEIISIDTITNACANNPKNDYLYFTIRNKGIRPIVQSDTLKFGYKLKNNQSFVETFVLNKSLGINETTQLKFKSALHDLDQPGLYRVKVFPIESKPGFYDTNNDTSFKDINIYPIPQSGLADSFSTGRIDTLKITPNQDVLYSYKWSDNSTNSSWSPVTEGKYWVNIKINDPNSCAIQDTFYIRRLTRNLAIGSLLSPTKSCKLNSKALIKFSVKNIGSDTINFKEIPSIEFHYKLNNQLATSLSKPLIKKIFPGDSLIITFPDSIFNLKTGDSLKIYNTAIPWEINTDNDTLKYNFSEYGFPKINLGNDTSIVNAYLQLNAGTNFKNYLWNDSSTNNSYKARSSGLHWVKVTDYNNCSSSDTINISIQSRDIAMESIDSPISACNLLSNDTIAIKVKNTGTSIILSGTSIHLTYKVNESEINHEDFILNDDLISGKVFSYKFLKKYDFSAKNVYTIEATSTIDGDMDSENNVLSKKITNYGYPTVDLGNDVNFEGREYELKITGLLGISYLWQDTLKGLSLKIRNTGNYWLKATDSISGCTKTDSIHINIILNDLSISNISSPASNKACANSFKEIKLIIQNTGNTSILQGTSIYLGFKVNNSIRKEKILLPKTLIPGEKYEFTFNNPSQFGENYFKVFLEYEKDIDKTNDSLNYSLQLIKNPTVDFGDKDQITSYDAVILNAGAGDGFTYLWNNKETSQYKKVSFTGAEPKLYSVLVAEPLNNCTGTDSVKVLIINPDVKIKSIKKSNSQCIEDIKELYLSIQNTGNYLLSANDTIIITLTNQNKIVKENLILQKLLEKGDSISFTLKNISPFLNTGINNLKLHARVNRDFNLNDSLAISFDLGKKPVVELCNAKDTVFAIASYKIETNLGENYDYLWKNNSTNNYYVADTTGIYWLKATDKKYGCTGTDSVFIDIEIQDIALTELKLNGNLCEGNDGSISISIKNMGNRTIPKGEKINITISANSLQLIKIDTLTNGLLNPGQTYSYQLPINKKYLLPGSYTLGASINFTKDQNSSNNYKIITAKVYNKPILTLSKINDTLVVEEPYTISAGENSNYTYLWNTGQKGQLIEAKYSGKYSVTAIDELSQCTNKDSAYIILLAYDLGIKINVPQEKCLNQFNSLEVEIENMGKYSFPAQTKLKFDVKINDEYSFAQEFTTTATLTSKMKMNYVLFGFKNKIKAGNSLISIKLHNDLDSIKNNDTSSVRVVLNNNPQISLGENDTLKVLHSVTLQAKTIEAVSYSWNTGESTDKISVNNDGLYSVTVTSLANDCQNYDKVYVKFVHFDGAISNAHFSTPACFGTDQILKIDYSNVSEATLIEKDTINFKITINTKTESYSHVIKDNLEPGENLQLTYKIDKNNVKEGTNILEITGSNRKDVNTTNNILKKNIEVSPSPKVLLANGQKEVSFRIFYNLDAGPGFTSYLWNTKETKQSIIASTSGWYKVIVSNENGCLGSDSVKLIKKTPVEELNNTNAISVFPVPSTTGITIVIQNISDQDFILEISSMDFKTIVYKEIKAKNDEIQEWIGLNGWKKGTYNLRISSKNSLRVYYSKFIVQ